MSQAKLSPLMAVGWDGEKSCGGKFQCSLFVRFSPDYFFLHLLPLLC